MDCQMPVMDGFEATKIIRKEYGDVIQIIAMTAYASKEDEHRCYKAGMNKFVTKPVDLEVLDEMLGINSKNKGTDNTEIELSILIIEVHKLMDKINFDYETSYDLILTYVEQVKLGLDEIEKFYEKKDYAQISRKLHQLKGASAAVRIERMKKTFEKSENLIKQNKITEAMNLIEATKEDPLFK
jgi:CheY-like chemotaxis protein